ncbi:hypothetical protein [Kallipyga massiliensis]|uniref:hypothetical protein n=1 Tax=Kallipyga massiliensis TaxID=1472764 RepID=UPI0026EABF0A|nr:hypothetical protein [Kallipyga massiliensis]
MDFLASSLGKEGEEKESHFTLSFEDFNKDAGGSWTYFLDTGGLDWSGRSWTFSFRTRLEEGRTSAWKKLEGYLDLDREGGRAEIFFDPKPLGREGRTWIFDRPFRVTIKIWDDQPDYINDFFDLERGGPAGRRKERIPLRKSEDGYEATLEVGEENQGILNLFLEDGAGRPIPDPETGSGPIQISYRIGAMEGGEEGPDRDHHRREPEDRPPTTKVQEEEKEDPAKAEIEETEEKEDEKGEKIPDESSPPVGKGGKTDSQAPRILPARGLDSTYHFEDRLEIQVDFRDKGGLQEVRRILDGEETVISLEGEKTYTDRLILRGRKKPYRLAYRVMDQAGNVADTRSPTYPGRPFFQDRILVSRSLLLAWIHIPGLFWGSLLLALVGAGIYFYLRFKNLHKFNA